MNVLLAGGKSGHMKQKDGCIFCAQNKVPSISTHFLQLSKCFAKTVFAAYESSVFSFEEFHENILNVLKSSPFKADSHIACRSHATPMPFPWHTVTLRV